MRKLASIQKIEEVQSIEGADQIEKARVLGWWVVIKKNQFKVGDLAIYFEIDSLLPVTSQFEFLSKGQKPKQTITDDGKLVEGWRLKTIRLRGQVSQGLLTPLSDFPEITATETGTDLTNTIGVYKFDPPLPASISGESKGYIPGFIPKTDEERIQSIPDLLDKLRSKRFYITSKLDGTSTTIFKYENDFNVCGRTLNYIEDDKNVMWRIANQYNLKEKLPDGFAIQGECIGESIQDNRQRIKGQEIYVFYVIDIAKAEYLGLDDMKRFVADLGMKTVPIIDENFILDHTVDQLLQMANGPCPINSSVPQEGIVFRLYNSTKKVTFKAISNEYLIKYGL